MTQINDSETGGAIRTKLNAALAKTDNLTANGQDLVTAGKLEVGSDVAFAGAIVERNYTFPTTTTPTLDPANGTHQKITLTAATTFTSAIADGENVTLIILGGDQHTVTWFSVTWVTDLGSEPTLRANDAATFWRFGSVTYAAHIGGWA